MAIGDEPKIPGFGNGVQKDTSSGKGFNIYETLSFLKTLSLFLIAAFFLRASVVEAYKIPSGSMIPTLLVGDHILVSKLAFGFRLPLVTEMLYQYSTPKRGDVVVFTRPDDPQTPYEDESKINIIKRIIGLPDDIVEVRGTEVLIDNQPYSEEYVRWEDNGIPEGNFGPEKIPAGTVLLLGDNRDQSRDSRFWTNHFLDMKRIKGKAFMIYWSSDDFRRIGKIIR